jgi:hypothetical protein
VTLKLCVKCGILPVTAVEFVSEKLRQYCSVCVVKAIKQLPNPDCEYCLGQGEYYWHSSDCINDLCALAGGYGDCEGQMTDCNCSVSDGLEL